jgi:hypothetical protein
VPIDIVAEIEQLPALIILTNPEELLTEQAPPLAEYVIVPSLDPADGVATTEKLESPYVFEYAVVPKAIVREPLLMVNVVEIEPLS